jgi:UDP-N-acetylmuramate dehydrogenase
MTEYYKKLQEFGKVKTSEPLKKHTTFKIGGTAKYLVVVDSVDDLVALLRYLDGGGIPYMMLGGGSNMLVGDDGFDGVVIKMRACTHRVVGDELIADAGCNTVSIAQEAMRAGLSGFEWGVGVPGTIGGAVRGNAGAMGSEMGDIVSMVEVYVDGEVTELSTEQCDFGYRHSVFKEVGGGVILRVRLHLVRADGKDLMKKALEHLKYRNASQPQGWASTGCIFKNYKIKDATLIEKLQAQFADDEKMNIFLKKGIISAGWLIEQSGMKGRREGQAEVSERHGNFIVNLGGATALDVHTLIGDIERAVYDKYGIHLEEEISII